MPSDSDLAGDVEVDTAPERPFLRAKLVSQRLDFDDLAGFVGAPPKTDAGETANAEQKAEAAKVRASGRVLPSKPTICPSCARWTPRCDWVARRINAPSLPLDDMDATLSLRDGLLELHPLNFGVAGGDIRSNIRMDARKPQISTRLKAQIRGVHLGKLFPDAKLAQQAEGAIGGDVALAGDGNSIAAMLGSSDGDVGVAMGPGHVGNLIMELAGLDIAESLKFLITKDKQIPLRCAFADFGVRDGLMTSRSLALDTTDTLVIGEGTVNLKDEKARPAARATAEGPQHPDLPLAAAHRWHLCRPFLLPRPEGTGRARRHCGGAVDHRPARRLAGDGGAGPGQGHRLRRQVRALNAPAAASAGDVALQLVDIAALRLDHGLDQVADRDHAFHRFALDHRQMPEAALGHDLHAVLDTVVELRSHHLGGHDLRHPGTG